MRDLRILVFSLSAVDMVLLALFLEPSWEAGEDCSGIYSIEGESKGLSSW